MQVFLVKQNEKFSIFKYLFKKIEVIQDKIIINFNIVKLKRKIKIAKKISKILIKNNSNTVIISKNLKKDIMFLDLLYSQQLNIITGNRLFKMILEDYLEKVIVKNNLKKEETEIAVTVNNNNEWIRNLIINLSKKYKTIKIVTNNIKYFKELEEKLFEKYGIIVFVTNNKKKALKKTNIILNLDFPEELINKYIIFENSIIINLEEKVKIHKKRFCGKIINNYNIDLKEHSKISQSLKKEEYKEFDLKDLVECYVLNNKEELKNVFPKV